MYEEVSSGIKNIIANYIGTDASEVKDEYSVIEDLGADSLDSLELIMSIEEKFNIEIKEEDAKKLNTVKDLIIYVDAKVTK